MQQLDLETFCEWCLALVLAALLFALFVWVDQHPSWWGIMGLNLLLGLLMAAGTVAGGLMWHAEAAWPEEPDDAALLGQFVGLTLVLGWLAAILPIVLLAPGQAQVPPWVDDVARLSWLALATAGSLALVIAPPAPEPWRNRLRWVFCGWLLSASLWPMTSGLYRLGLGILLGLALGGFTVVGLCWSRRPTE